MHQDITENPQSEPKSSTRAKQQNTPKKAIIAFCILTALIPVLSVDMQRSITYMSGITALLFYGLYVWLFSVKPVFSKKTMWFVVVALGFLFAHTTLWAKFPEASTERLIKLSLLLPLQILVISLALSLNKEQLKLYIHYFSYGVVAGCLLISFELASGGLIYNLIRGLPYGDFVVPAEFNRASVIIVLYFFSAFTFLKFKFNKKISGIILFPPLLATLFIMDSQSAQLAFAVSILTFLFFPYKLKIGWNILKLVILSTMVLAPFIIGHIYQNYAQNIQDFFILSQGYAGHRLEIWDYISRYALQNPIHGLGIEATRQIKDFDSGLKFHNESALLHPHNFILQIWLEFGFIGIALAMTLMWKAISYIQYNFSVAQQKILLPTMMAALVPASTAYNMWQGWWIALLFHLVAISLIACKFVETKTISNSEQGAPPS